jgi:hypothetical protein
MAITTNAQLETAIGNWMDRDDLSARIPEFVALAEARFNRILRAPDMLTRDDAFVVDGQYETLPSGFIEPKRIVLLTSPVTPLEYVTPEVMADLRIGRTASGKPIYYTVTGGNLEFFPTPDSAYTASVLYYTRLTANAVSENWLFASHPDIYLWGALVAAEAYIRNDERLGIWKQQLDEGISELNRLSDRKSTPGASRPRTGGFE